METSVKKHLFKMLSHNPKLYAEQDVTKTALCDSFKVTTVETSGIKPP